MNEKQKSLNAFIFGTLVLSFIFLIPIGMTDSSKMGESVVPVIGLSSMLIFGVGVLFTNRDWIRSTQLIFIVGLMILLSKISNPLIGIGVGTVAFGILTYGFKLKTDKYDDGEASKSVSFLVTGLKWLVVTVMGTLVSLGIEHLINK